MRTNSVKAALRRGEVALGTFVVEFKTLGIGPIAANAGAEFVVLDEEHAPSSTETTAGIIAAARAYDLVPIVRVQTAQYPFISRVLDAGAMGIMVPMVESAAQAQLVVASAKYPPLGRRGAIFGVPHDDYGNTSVLDAMRSANDEVLVIAQIETRDGLDNIDAIAAVEGIDVLWIGHFDLTNSLGIPGQFTHPTYLAALDRCVATARRHGKTAGFMAPSVEEAHALIARGFRAIAYSGDVWIYGDALRRGIADVRAGLRVPAT